MALEMFEVFLHEHILYISKLEDTAWTMNFGSVKTSAQKNSQSLTYTSNKRYCKNDRAFKLSTTLNVVLIKDACIFFASELSLRCQ